MKKKYCWFLYYFLLYGCVSQKEIRSTSEAYLLHSTFVKRIPSNIYLKSDVPLGIFLTQILIENIQLSGETIEVEGFVECPSSLSKLESQPKGRKVNCVRSYEVIELEKFGEREFRKKKRNCFRGCKFSFKLNPKTFIIVAENNDRYFKLYSYDEIKKHPQLMRLNNR
jgi:hypothetical protein